MEALKSHNTSKPATRSATNLLACSKTVPQAPNAQEYRREAERLVTFVEDLLKNLKGRKVLRTFLYRQKPELYIGPFTIVCDRPSALTLYFKPEGTLRMYSLCTDTDYMVRAYLKAFICENEITLPDSETVIDPLDEATKDWEGVRI